MIDLSLKCCSIVLSKNWGLSRNLSCHWYLRKKSGKIWLKSFYPKKEVIFEISKKKKCDFMCYTWYETIKHWHHWHCCWWQKTWLVLDPRLVLQKISQYCPETRKLRVSTVRKYSKPVEYTLRVHDVTLNLVKFVYSLMSEMCGGSQKYSLQPLKSLQITDSADRFSFSVLNVLGLKNSTDFKKTMQYYTILPIFEHFGC